MRKEAVEAQQNKDRVFMRRDEFMYHGGNFFELTVFKLKKQALILFRLKNSKKNILTTQIRLILA